MQKALEVINKDNEVTVNPLDNFQKNFTQRGKKGSFHQQNAGYETDVLGTTPTD